MLEESGDYEVTYTSSENCDSIYVLSLVFDLPVLSLPTAFSPNGDGINDFFKPVTYGGNVQLYSKSLIDGEKWSFEKKVYSI